MEDKLHDLDEFISSLWTRLSYAPFVISLSDGEKFRDKRLVAIYLTQVYHYAVHTPRHQALVAVNPANKDVKYMQYCFQHAYEETGHELMALHDLRTLGFEVNEQNMPAPFASTELMIAYLYKLAQSADPIHHLGYGFWSENACPFIHDFMNSLMTTMSLPANAMTFYSAHVTIDKEHALHVRDIVARTCKTNEDWEGIKRAAAITFDLTAGIIKEAIEMYDSLESGEASQYAMFRKPQPAEAVTA